MKLANGVQLAVVGVLLAACVSVAPAGAAPAGRQFTVYSLAEQEQYVNNQDDRTRGKGNNPFGNYRDNAPIASKDANGPFPGDEAVFDFDLYGNAALTKRIGSATFTCQYNFAKNADCDVAFDLKGKGTLIATGAFNFEAKRFTLGLTGGYGSYVAAKGVVAETPSAHHAQKLRFEIK
jgi:hypothetical protein